MAPRATCGQRSSLGFAPWVWQGLALLLVLPLSSSAEPPHLVVSPVTTEPSRAAAAATPPTLTLDQAVRQALVNNPLLMTMRQQRGLAAAAVVIANTYPFNPVYQLLLMGDNGPEEAAVTNHAFHEHIVRLDLEVCGQGGHRRAAAQAALSRAEWDIANQEVLTAIGTIRAFNTVLYRADKLKVLDTAVSLDEEAAEQVRRLAGAGGRLRFADLILARSDVDAARAARGPGRSTLAVARADLRRFLGSLDNSLVVNGTLDLPPTTGIDLAALTETALRQRPDVQARHAAVAEAEARWRLEKANRFGNPSVGPAAEYNETRVTFIGVSLVTPIPLLNRRQGEIQMREAEVMRAQQELMQFETQARQEVLSALARLADARATADNFRNEVLPNLQRDRKKLEELFARGEPGLDALRILDVRRRILKAYDGYLDALYEVSQARADLAAAVGDPSLAIPLDSVLPEPKRAQP